MRAPLRFVLGYIFEALGVLHPLLLGERASGGGTLSVGIPSSPSFIESDMVDRDL